MMEGQGWRWDDPRTWTTVSAVIVLPLIYILYRRLFCVPTDEQAVPFTWRAPAEVSPGWKGTTLKRPSIDPSTSDAPLLHPSSTHAPYQHIIAYDPATAQHLGTYPATLPSQIDEMIQRAAVAQKEWAKTTWKQRRRVLRSLLKWVVDDMESIVRLACRDTGKTSAYCFPAHQATSTLNPAPHQ